MVVYPQRLGSKRSVVNMKDTRILHLFESQTILCATPCVDVCIASAAGLNAIAHVDAYVRHLFR